MHADFNRQLSMNFVYFQVRPKDLDELDTEIKEYLTTDKNIFTETIAEGDLWAMSDLFIPLSTGLNNAGWESHTGIGKHSQKALLFPPTEYSLGSFCGMLFSV